jgi:hypothetical protein
VVRSIPAHPLLILAIVGLACQTRHPLPETKTPTVPGDAGADAGGGALPTPAVVPPISLPEDRPGSRLKQRSWSAADGASVPGPIRDTVLGADCTWTPLEGSLRCIPSSYSLVNRYADPQCTRPLRLHTPDPCTLPPEYISALSAVPTCPASMTLFRRGPRIQPEAIFDWNGQQCSPVRIPAGGEVYELGEPVPPRTFVGATRTVEALADGWSRVYFDAEDGSRWASGLRRGEFDCRVAIAADGERRCIPVTAGSVSGGRVQSDCTSPVAEGLRSSCSPGEILLSENRPADCTTRTAVRRAGPRVDSAYFRVNASCVPQHDPSSDAYAVGDELPPAGFPAVTEGILEGAGRLKRYAASTSAGTFGSLRLWDSKLGSPCGAGVLDREGDFRCFAGATPATPMFADPRCTRRVLRDDPCRQWLFVGDAIPGTCPPRHRLFRLGPVVAVERLYVPSAAGCVAAASAPPPQAIFREVGGEVDPADFVQLWPSR